MNFKSTSRRKDRLIRDRRKDTYIDQIFLKEPAIVPERVLFNNLLSRTTYNAQSIKR